MEKYNFNKLDNDIDEIYDICKGFTNSLDHFYKTKNGFDDLDPLVEKIVAFLPLSLREEEQSLYLCFFKMAISFLECSCNPEDKIVKSIRVLSTVLEKHGSNKSTFDYMMEKQKDFKRTALEEKYYQICLHEYTRWNEMIEAEMNYAAFTETVNVTLEDFLIDQGLCVEDIDYTDSFMKSCVLQMTRKFRHEYLNWVSSHEE